MTDRRTRARALRVGLAGLLALGCTGPRPEALVLTRADTLEDATASAPGDAVDAARSALQRGERAIERGAVDEARVLLDQARILGAHAPDVRAAAASALAHLERGAGRAEKALELDRLAVEAADATRNDALKVRTRINAARGALDLERAERAKTWLTHPSLGLDASLSQELQLALADTLARAGIETADTKLQWGANDRYVLLIDAAPEPRILARAELGRGRLLAFRGALDDAHAAFERASLAGQSVGDDRVLHEADHAMGRLHVRRGEPVLARSAYARAIATATGPHARATNGFASILRARGERFGAVYYEYAALLLDLHARSSDAESDALLVEVREVLESLKADEIRDYYGDVCVDRSFDRARDLDALATRDTVIVYPIVLDDRLELLVTRSGRLERIRVDVARDRMVETVQSFRRGVEAAPSRAYLRPAQALHRWLIEPLGPLEAAGVTTLVVVPDAPLRALPWAALHDGERFLVERVASVVVPGLRMADPRPIDLPRLRTLAGGLSVSREGYAALPHVRDELATLSRDGGAEVLLDEAFTRGDWKARIRAEPWGVVHVATHAAFGRSADESFLLAHDGRIGFDDFEALIGRFAAREQPLELLTLSACETAAGDERAALGLSGIAVRSGARSVLATLWTVDDATAAELVAAFYAALRDTGTPRAEALRRAQRALLERDPRLHPAYWAPFVLINNWM